MAVIASRVAHRECRATIGRLMPLSRRSGWL